MSTGYTPDIDGYDLHGAGAMVFDTKAEEVTDYSGIDLDDHVRLVRGGDVSVTTAGDTSTINLDRVVVFEDGEVDMTGRAPDFAAIAETLGVTEAALMEALGEPGDGA